MRCARSWSPAATLARVWASSVTDTAHRGRDCSDLGMGASDYQHMLSDRTSSQRTFIRLILNLMATDARLRKVVVILLRFQLILRFAS